MTTPPTTDRPPPLTPGEVHAWRVATDRAEEVLEQFGKTLSEDERARGDRFRSADDRSRFLSSRAALRSILGRYSGRPPASLEFRLGPYGKPAIEGPPAIEFNLSHSGDLALVAVAIGRRVGVDVERARPVAERDAIVARFFSARERDEILALPDPLKDDAFFRVWTCKEAYIKALGTGLSEPLDGFSVAADPRGPARLVEVAGDTERAARWTIRELPVGEGYAAAVAAEGTGWSVQLLDFGGIGGMP